MADGGGGDGGDSDGGAAGSPVLSDGSRGRVSAASEQRATDSPVVVDIPDPVSPTTTAPPPPASSGASGAAAAGSTARATGHGPGPVGGTDDRLAALGLGGMAVPPSSVEMVWELSKRLPDSTMPTLYQHSPAFGLPSKDPSCLAAQAALRFAGVDFKVCNCDNDWMSPSGSLPFLRLYTNKLLVGTDQIQRYLDGRADRAAPALLDPTRDGVMRSYIAMLAAKCHAALMFELWCEDECRAKIARPVFLSAVYSWPLDMALSRLRQYSEWLVAFPLGRARRTPRMLYDEAGHAYAALSEKLLEQPFFFGDRPSELDAVVYGHLAFVIDSNLPSNRLRPLIVKHANLVAFCARVRAQHFPPAILRAN